MKKHSVNLEGLFFLPSRGESPLDQTPNGAFISVGTKMQKVHYWMLLLALLGLATMASAQYISYGNCPKVDVKQDFFITPVSRTYQSLK